MTPAAPAAVRRYLEELERALDGADPDQSADILADVAGHLADSLTALGANPDPAQVQAVIDALGPPRTVAAEAKRGLAGPAAPPGKAGPRGQVALIVVAGLVALAAAFFNPVLGLVLGAGGLAAGLVGLSRAAKRHQPRAAWVALVVLSGIVLAQSSVMLAGLLAWGTLTEVSDPALGER